MIVDLTVTAATRGDVADALRLVAQEIEAWGRLRDARNFHFSNRSMSVVYEQRDVENVRPAEVAGEDVRKAVVDLSGRGFVGNEAAEVR